MITAEAPAASGKYLTFGLGTEDYGLDILKVREIIGCMEITPVPRTPAHVQGVINLRGQVIPVINLRAKFGMAPVERTKATCVIVVETQQDDRRVSTGIIVDRVCEVVNIPASSIQDPPSLKQTTTPPYVRGLGQVGQSVKILLDIEHVLNSDADILAHPVTELETATA
jgi:purine-binding chemotaxis protein CheW